MTLPGQKMRWDSLNLLKGLFTFDIYKTEKIM